MAKRTSLKGRGADIFAPGHETSTPLEKQAVTPAQQPTSKATFYLPLDILDRLEKVWLAKRAKKSKLKKSDLVRNALESFLSQQEKDLES